MEFSLVLPVLRLSYKHFWKALEIGLDINRAPFFGPAIGLVARYFYLFIFKHASSVQFIPPSCSVSQ